MKPTSPQVFVVNTGMDATAKMKCHRVPSEPAAEPFLPSSHALEGVQNLVWSNDGAPSQRRASPAGASPARQRSFQPLAVGATMEVTKSPKP
jgi:hypothetical protein